MKVYLINLIHALCHKMWCESELQISVPELQISVPGEYIKCFPKKEIVFKKSKKSLNSANSLNTKNLFAISNFFTQLRLGIRCESSTSR